jgi:hypothetical protein
LAVDVELEVFAHGRPPGPVLGSPAEAVRPDFQTLILMIGDKVGSPRLRSLLRARLYN